MWYPQYFIVGHLSYLCVQFDALIGISPDSSNSFSYNLPCSLAFSNSKFRKLLVHQVPPVNGTLFKSQSNV